MKHSSTQVAAALLLAMLAMLAGSAACAYKGTSAPRSTTLRDGIYHFTERPAQSNQVIDGDFTVLADTVWVDAQPGPCRYDQTSTSRAGPFVYQCADVTFSFDRIDPVRKAMYRTTITVTDRKVTCVRYETTASGQRVCAQQQTEYVDRQVPVSGMLRPVRVGDPHG